ncbi:MAG: hypothetical protein QOH06_2258 [Acidobacteriota bacterium]|nr:hypothetical protein [Acidobacteriota bacterium]
MGIGQVLRACLGGSQNPPYDSGQRAICVAHANPRLAGQACIYQGVVARATIELGEDHARDYDLSAKAYGRSQSSANFPIAAPGPPSQSHQGLGIEHDAIGHARSPAYFSTSDSSTGPCSASS